MCNGNQMLCGDACADLATDANHCGACGHSCLGAACNAGQCAATALYTGHQAVLVRVDEQRVFFSSHIDILSMPLTGGATTKVNKEEGVLAFGARNMEIAGNNVFWTTPDSPNFGYISKVSKSGFGQVHIVEPAVNHGQPHKLALGDLDPSGNATAVYWCANGNGQLPKTAIVKTTWNPSGTGTSTKLADASALYLRGITLHQTDVYVLSAQPSQIVRVPQAGGAATVFTPGTWSGIDLLSDAENLYVLDVGPGANGKYADGKVWKIPFADGVPVALVTGVANPSAFATDGERIYYTSAWNESGQLADGAVFAVPIAGGPAVTIADKQPAPRGIAVDGTHVYWANYGVGPNQVDGGVLKAPK
ncbi:hypothetical protein E8A74_37790 [Polyangium fumosum]|uniref:DUF5050 domain-containing protein n=2 Tax=Polyangium fumosum TaxID=889272 RepID=A0A4U1IY66_9BACT|nr:hypothetical protein E8A74_37790 [Polyangium fumosum]